MTILRNLRRLFLQRNEAAPVEKAIEGTRAVKTEKAIQAYDRLLQSTTTAQTRDRSQRSREREA